MIYVQSQTNVKRGFIVCLDDFIFRETNCAVDFIIPSTSEASAKSESSRTSPSNTNFRKIVSRVGIIFREVAFELPLFLQNVSSDFFWQASKVSEYLLRWQLHSCALSRVVFVFLKQPVAQVRFTECFL